MDLDELSHRLEIQDLLARYCHALDRQDWTAFRKLFAENAQLDFTAFGGPTGDVEALIAFLQPILAGLASSHHAISTITIELAPAGRSAKVRSAAQVAMTMALADASEHTSFSGLWYEDVLERTAEGWRIRTRTQVKAWTFNMAPAT
jgi:hypothetical protein